PKPAASPLSPPTAASTSSTLNSPAHEPADQQRRRPGGPGESLQLALSGPGVGPVVIPVAHVPAVAGFGNTRVPALLTCRLVTCADDSW
ncbi:hypothetical protein, partial [Mycobacterium marinum]|uniref:hypothetical protein n=1 Tax=Mycobacterium marinum TaxID=1781 RepID=UPI0021C324B5